MTEDSVAPARLQTRVRPLRRALAAIGAAGVVLAAALVPTAPASAVVGDPAVATTAAGTTSVPVTPGKARGSGLWGYVGDVETRVAGSTGATGIVYSYGLDLSPLDGSLWVTDSAKVAYTSNVFLCGLLSGTVTGGECYTGQSRLHHYDLTGSDWSIGQYQADGAFAAPAAGTSDGVGANYEALSAATVLNGSTLPNGRFGGARGVTVTQDGAAWVNDADFALNSVSNTRKAIRVLNPDATESALSFGTGGWPTRYNPDVLDYTVGGARMGSGNIIITSQTPELLKEYRTDGTFVRNIYLNRPAGSAYPGDAGFRSPYAVAVDPASGELLVGYIDPGTGNSGFIERIDPTSCTTEPVPGIAGAQRDRCAVIDTIGVGTLPNGNGNSGSSNAVTFSIQVDPTTSDVYVATRQGLPYVFAQDGTPKGRFSAYGLGAGNGQISTMVRGIAFDARGFLYATVGEGTAATRVEIFARTPDPITGLTGAYTSPARTEATLTWDALATGVTADAQAPLRDYVVEQSTDGGATWSVVTTPVATTTGAAVTGLDPAASYTFRVSAWNEAGNGDWAVTPLAGPAPGGFQVTKEVVGTPEALALVGTTTFEVTYSLDGVDADESLVVADGETAAVTDLPAGTVVELAEIPPTVAGVTFGSPRFLVDGVETTTLTIGVDENAEVVLENPATVVVRPTDPPTETPTPTDPPTQTPTPTDPPTQTPTDGASAPTTSPSASPSSSAVASTTSSSAAPSAVPGGRLSETGAAGAGVAAGAGALLLVAGAVVLLARRRALS